MRLFLAGIAVGSVLTFLGIGTVCAWMAYKRDVAQARRDWAERMTWEAANLKEKY